MASLCSFSSSKCVTNRENTFLAGVESLRTSSSKSQNVALSRKCGSPAGACRAQANSHRDLALEAFNKRVAFKVIAGLQNFNAQNVAAIVRAAQKGGATHVDIACDADLVRLVLSLTSIPVCVSAVEPEKLVSAVKAGAHMVEIGNFDSFYDKGQEFSAEDVLELAKRTRLLLPDTVLSVTVPHKLPLPEQVELAEALQACGADIIQTEGGMSADPTISGVQGLLQKATPTLAAVYSISRAVDIPVMGASGLSSVTVPLAFASGASGVGVGSAINKLNDELAMLAAVRAISEVINVGEAERSNISYTKL